MARTRGDSSVLAVLADEDLNGHLLTGLVRRRPDLHFDRVVDIGLSGRSDQEVLAWAAKAGRVLLTHDARTVPEEALARIRAGVAMPGVVVIPQTMAIGDAIEQLELILFVSEPEELEGRVLRLPL